MDSVATAAITTLTEFFMTTLDAGASRLRWARFRYGVIAPLFSAPPPNGALQSTIDTLAAKTYAHPTTHESIRLGRSTVERWYYLARNERDPIEALARKLSDRCGNRPSLAPSILKAMEEQYLAHPSWTYQLHHDNLVALAKKNPELGVVPSYTTLCRAMLERGWDRTPRARSPRAPGALDKRERRSFEVSHVHALWHLDFHQGSRKVLTPEGAYQTVHLLGILDDRSRLLCHLQWYREETAEALVHGLCQAMQKRGVPRALLTDNGSAMMAGETKRGLATLGVVHQTTLAYTPEQNGKQESFWGRIEGRLLPMLEGERNLSLALLNKATQAWVEREYNVKVHSETKQSPLDRFCEGPNVGRECPSSEDLRDAFTIAETRTVRKSDGTVSVEGVRFEIPSRYRTLRQVALRYARWDKAHVYLCDPRTGKALCTLTPLDREANADGRRRRLEAAVPVAAVPVARPVGVAPHLQAMMDEQERTGLPPAYLPFQSKSDGGTP